jgi:hypothetical protein
MTPRRRRKFDDHAITARLSYFLWSSRPDRRLLSWRSGTAAEARRLAGTGRAHNDPKARQFTANFAGQWLDLQINATSPMPALANRRLPVLVPAARAERFFEKPPRAASA